MATKELTSPSARSTGWSPSLKFQRRFFLLPAVIITLLVVIFPTVFGIYVSFTDWRLNAVDGRQFSGLDNFRRMWGDDRFWNALKNNLTFVFVGIPIQFAIAL